MSIKIISPHCDDAVLGLGQMIAAAVDQTDVQVVTVFAGLPAPGVLSDYDRDRGFTSSLAAMNRRRAEDIAACTLTLGASVLHMDYLDRQYEPLRPITRKSEIVRELRRLDLWADGADVFVPLGIGHPDHVLVGECSRLCAPDYGCAVYEELPYRVDWPEQAADALAAIRSDRWDIAALPEPIPAGDRAMKAAAISEYRSQFPDGADNPALLCPERVWRIARSTG